MDDSSNTLMSVKKTRLLDDLFVFKEPEKEVKRRLHDASLHNVNFLRAWKETEMDSDL